MSIAQAAPSLSCLFFISKSASLCTSQFLLARFLFRATKRERARHTGEKASSRTRSRRICSMLVFARPSRRRPNHTENPSRGRHGFSRRTRTRRTSIPRRARGRERRLASQLRALLKRRGPGSILHRLTRAPIPKRHQRLRLFTVTDRRREQPTNLCR